MSPAETVIVDYGMGNLASIQKMADFVGVQTTITNDPERLEAARKIILPGVGAFHSGMNNLSSLGLIPVLRKKVLENQTPLLGICLGAQLLTRRSQEGTVAGLGFFDADTVKFQFGDSEGKLKIPHMGWNFLYFRRAHPFFSGLESECRFYFAHSYHFVCDHDNDVLATTCYGYPFPSVIQKGNLIGVQFHPEKSHRYGMHFFRRFLKGG